MTTLATNFKQKQGTDTWQCSLFCFHVVVSNGDGDINVDVQISQASFRDNHKRRLTITPSIPAPTSRHVTSW